MFKISSIVRRLAVGLAAASLMLGTVSAPASAEASGKTTILAVHGVWKSFSSRSNRKTLLGIMTKMNKGGTTAIVTDGDTVSLILTDPSWNLKVNRRVPVRVTVDGHTLTGTAVVTSSDMIEMEDLTSNAVKELADGDEAVIDVNEGDIVWTLNLNGFTAAMGDIARLYKTS